VFPLGLGQTEVEEKVRQGRKRAMDVVPNAKPCKLMKEAQYLKSLRPDSGTKTPRRLTEAGDPLQGQIKRKRGKKDQSANKRGGLQRWIYSSKRKRTQRNRWVSIEDVRQRSFSEVEGDGEASRLWASMA
jgi:hypothetical protein